MKHFFAATCFLLAAVSCSKKLPDVLAPSSAIIVSDNALAPLQCHTNFFTTNYPILPGKIPPFRFAKTFYADSRVKTLNMLSRANPVYSGFMSLAYETIGTFYYAPNKASFIGTRQLWEYYITPAKAAGKKSISKKSISLTFDLDANGYCTRVFDNYEWTTRIVIDYDYYTPKPNSIVLFIASTETENKYFKVINDKYGNVLKFEVTSPDPTSTVSFTYDYTKPTGSKKYNYAPTQNLISQEYSLLEVMQWLPPTTHQRKSVSGEFYANGKKVVQTQYYKNQVFDLNGNLTSYTYYDNVAQKTTWYCK